MARVRTIESINAEIAKIQEELDNLHQKYDKTAAKLEVFAGTKAKVSDKARHESPAKQREKL
jgi:Skp family chaperone for outer membrane proteins